MDVVAAVAVAVVGSGVVAAGVAVEESPSHKDEREDEEDQFRLLLGFD